ncbi:hypothetical protein DL96DRAFT_1600909 [Flagelloscypha sp. PMI_526]|nr:hypothetical protein DL96DRAFT_1600909 [Flagelloscypha sp. PMI_526]
MSGAPPPVFSIPAEILGNIFLFAQQNSTRSSQKPVELVLSHVCRHFRWTCLTTPFLWNRLCLYKPKLSKRGRAYLSRSNEAPLDLTLDFHQWEHRHQKRAPTLSLSFLAQCAANLLPKCSRFVLFSGNPVTSPILSHFMQGSHHPFLTSLCIPSAERQNYSDKLPPTQLYTSDLCFLHIGSLDFVQLTTFNALSSLTTLFLDGQRGHNSDGIVDLLRCLATTPELRHLSLSGIWDRLPTTNIESIELSHLVALRFQGPHNCTSELLAVLRAPLLESVCFESVHRVLMDPLLMRLNEDGVKFPNIQDITIIRMPPHQLRFTATLFPTAKRVMVAFGGIGSYKNIMENEQLLWGNLQTLVIRHRSTITESIKDVRTFVLELSERLHQQVHIIVEEEIYEEIRADIPSNSLVTTGIFDQDEYGEIWSDINRVDPSRLRLV